jgi:hypothetical protein
LPRYWAEIWCVPTVSAVVEYAATPPLFSVTVPSGEEPSRKATLPEGTAPGPVSVAVKVTDVPAMMLLAEDRRATVGVAF